MANRGMISGGRKRHQPVRQKMHVRRGDRVRVIRGNFAGSEGTVLRVLPKEGRVVIEGVNLRKRHSRPSQANPEGGILTFEAPIHASNVMLLDPSSGEPTRTRARFDADVSESREGKRSRSKERIATKSGNPIPRTGA